MDIVIEISSKSNVFHNASDRISHTEYHWENCMSLCTEYGPTPGSAIKSKNTFLLYYLTRHTTFPPHKGAVHITTISVSC